MSESVPITAGLFSLRGDGSGRLLGAACGACGKIHFPSSPDCPYCSSENCVERELAARGVLRLFTRVTNRPPGYDGELPFGFGVVELPDGVQVIARLTEADPARLRFDMPVELVIVPLQVDGDKRQVVTYAFAPAGAAG